MTAGSLLRISFFQFNLSASVVNVDAHQITSGIVIENYALREISRLSTLGCSERSIYSESVSE